MDNLEDDFVDQPDPYAAMQQTSDFKQPSQTATFEGDAEQNVFVN